MNMASSVAEVEGLLGYRFRSARLLEEALTHSSLPDAASYQRLEFLGDEALGLLSTNHIFLLYPKLDPGHLSLLRAANISTEKLARVAIRHNLYRYLRRNTPALDNMVIKFERAIKGEGDFDEIPKAPKVLADLVESIAGAVYVDCEFDLSTLQKVFWRLLEPIVTLETLKQHAVTTLYEFCQKQGKQVYIKHWMEGSKIIADVYVDGKLLESGSSDNKETARLNASKAALKMLGYQLSDVET